MKARCSRPVIGLALVSSLLASSVSIFAVPQTTRDQNQNQTQTTAPNQTQSPDSKDSKSTAQATTPTTQQPAPKTNNKPLSTNEDPSMIGKRNINKGLWAKMAKGTEAEVREGRAAAAEVDRQAKFIEDPVVTEYVNRVGQNLVLHSDAKVPFTIKVIDADEVNAFALPGGFFYVNKGLILAADNEAELAGAMAHEIGHVAARHAMENEAKMQAMDIGMLAGILLGGGIIGNVLYNGGGLFEGLAFMKFSRGAEEEADRLGVQYMYAAGYDPNAMATMFEKLEAKNKKKPGFISRAFASHPMPADRRAAALSLAARFPEREEYVISTSEFQRVKARLMRLSNARVSTVGAANDNGPSGRPTLKRRQPAPDDTSNPDSQKPSGQQDSGPPKLKRADVPDPKPQQP